MARTMVQYEKVLEVLKAADGNSNARRVKKRKCEAQALHV
nr:MAG: hypothetical protein CM15mV30_0010 [uncultured marine virus]